MDSGRALAVAAGLSVAGAVIGFLLGLGAALSEDDGYWAFWVLGVIFAVVAALVDLARRRSSTGGRSLDENAGETHPAEIRKAQP